jgi:hypothetical protein
MKKMEFYEGEEAAKRFEAVTRLIFKPSVTPKPEPPAPQQSSPKS